MNLISHRMKSTGFILNLRGAEPPPVFPNGMQQPSSTFQHVKRFLAIGTGGPVPSNETKLSSKPRMYEYLYIYIYIYLHSFAGLNLASIWEYRLYLEYDNIYIFFQLDLRANCPLPTRFSGVPVLHFTRSFVSFWNRGAKKRSRSKVLQGE